MSTGNFKKSMFFFKNLLVYFNALPCIPALTLSPSCTLYIISHYLTYLIHSTTTLLSLMTVANLLEYQKS